MDYSWSFLVGGVFWTAVQWIAFRSKEWEYTLRHYGCHFVVAMFLGDRSFDCLKEKPKRPFPWRRWLECCIWIVLMLLFDVCGIGFYRNSEMTVRSPSGYRVAISSLSRVLLFAVASFLSIALLLLRRRH